jgi:hypothetical protein
VTPPVFWKWQLIMKPHLVFTEKTALPRLEGAPDIIGEDKEETTEETRWFVMHW